MSRFIFVTPTPSGMRYDLSFAWALLQRGEIIKFPLHFRVARVRAYGYLYQARCTYRITITLKYIIRRNGILPEFARRCRIYIKHKLIHRSSWTVFAITSKSRCCNNELKVTAAALAFLCSCPNIYALLFHPYNSERIVTLRGRRQKKKAPSFACKCTGGTLPPFTLRDLTFRQRRSLHRSNSIRASRFCQHTRRIAQHRACNGIHLGRVSTDWIFRVAPDRRGRFHLRVLPLHPEIE